MKKIKIKTILNYFKKRQFNKIKKYKVSRIKDIQLYLIKPNKIVSQKIFRKRSKIVRRKLRFKKYKKINWNKLRN